MTKFLLRVVKALQYQIGTLINGTGVSAYRYYSVCMQIIFRFINFSIIVFNQRTKEIVAHNL